MLLLTLGSRKGVSCKAKADRKKKRWGYLWISAVFITKQLSLNSQRNRELKGKSSRWPGTKSSLKFSCFRECSKTCKKKKKRKKWKENKIITERIISISLIDCICQCFTTITWFCTFRNVGKTPADFLKPRACLVWVQLNTRTLIAHPMLIHCSFSAEDIAFPQAYKADFGVPRKADLVSKQNTESLNINYENQSTGEKSSWVGGKGRKKHLESILNSEHFNVYNHVM